jgi:hypothetical protein
MTKRKRFVFGFAGRGRLTAQQGLAAAFGDAAVRAIFLIATTNGVPADRIESHIDEIRHIAKARISAALAKLLAEMAQAADMGEPTLRAILATHATQVALGVLKEAGLWEPKS